MTLKATPLNNAHRAAGAKMVDFGGWDMPVNYGSQIEEHNAVRTDVGMFDVAHMCVVDIKGANVRAFLRGLLANNVDKLQVSGKALYSCMLNPQGFVIDDLIVYFIDESWFRLVVNAGAIRGAPEAKLDALEDLQPSPVGGRVPLAHAIHGEDRGLDDVEVLPVLVQLLPVGREEGRQAVGPRGTLSVGGGDRGRGARTRRLACRTTPTRPRMRIATWNVNSVNARLPTVLFNHSHGGGYGIGKAEFIDGREYLARPSYAEFLTSLGYNALCFDAWIFGERSGIYIIDLGKTVKLFKEAEEFVSKLAAEGRTILFVTHSLDQVTQLSYRITGPWDNPRVERVEAGAPPAPAPATPAPQATPVPG